MKNTKILLTISLICGLQNACASENEINNQQNLPPAISRLMLLLKCFEKNKELEQSSICSEINWIVDKYLNKKIKFYEDCINFHKAQIAAISNEMLPLYEEQKQCIRTEEEPDGFGGKKLVRIATYRYLQINDEINMKNSKQNSEYRMLELYNKNLKPLIAIQKLIEESKARETNIENEELSNEIN